MFYKVESLKASLRNVMMSKSSPFVVKSDRLDMRASRKKLNKYWNSLNLIHTKFDTILGLTGAKKFRHLSPDEEYGISGLGGVCGHEDR